MSILFMNDPRAKTLEGMIAACEIFAKHHPSGKQALAVAGAEHDIIFGPCDADQIPEDSDDGKMLSALGWHVDEDACCWAYFC